MLGASKPDALLFKTLATLRTDAPLFRKVEELKWKGPTPGFPAMVEKLGDKKLMERCEKAALGGRS